MEQPLIIKSKDGKAVLLKGAPLSSALARDEKLKEVLDLLPGLLGDGGRSEK